jgi:3-hydroxyisobutyrate dehydrogenase
MAKETIALLGTGTMGTGMAHNLLAAGFGLRVWNRTRERAEPLAERGAAVASTPAEAAEGAGILLTMLADGEAVEAAVAGPSGGLSGLGDGALWVQSSTVGMDDTDRLGALAAERGVTFVDAPVLGTKQPAEQGQLIVLASGPEDARERCQPLFDAIGSRTIWVGEAGRGTRLKLVTNTWITGLLGALGSTIALARALDVDPEQFLGAIEGGPLGPAYARLKGDMMKAGDYPTSFSVTLAAKDVRLAREAAAKAGLDLPLLGAIAGQFAAAADLGLGDADMAAIYEAARRGA